MSRDGWPGYGICECSSCEGERASRRISGTAVVVVLLILVVWLLASGAPTP